MKFQNENEYLIHLLYCAIHDTVPENIPQNISLQKVFEIGKIHEVANIAYTAVQKLAEQLPAEQITPWREFYYNAVKRDSTQTKARKEILTAMHSHGIYTLEVQGTVVKQYYPQSHLRMMSDLDFIIPKDKLYEAQSIMQSIGYETKVAHEDTEIQASKNQLHIELHTEFFEEKNIVYKAINRPFSLAELQPDYTATVSETVFYLFHLLHTIKHATEFKGVGIRRIIDLYYLENALNEKADFSYIDSILKEFDLLDIKTSLIAVKDHWFCGAEPTDDLSELEQEIFDSGNQGTDEIFYKNKFKRERAQGKHFVKLRYIIDFIFPSKKDIYRAYPFCEKHRFPVVLCWVYRWIFSVFNKSKWENVKAVILRLKIK